MSDKARYIIVMENHNGITDYVNSYTVENNELINFGYDYWGEYYRYPRWETKEKAEEIKDLIVSKLGFNNRWAKIRVAKLRPVKKVSCSNCGHVKNQ